MSTVTLKNVKHSEFASHETDCFEASIYVDGHRCGFVSNDGCGGANRYHPWALMTQLDAIAADLPPYDLGDGPYPQTADIMIGDLLHDHLEKKRLARHMKKYVLYRIPGVKYEHGIYHSITAKYNPKIRDHLIAKHGPEVMILNEAQA